MYNLCFVALMDNICREKAREMFIHAYDNYMQHAYPADELKPLSCTGRWRTPPGDKDNRGTLDDSLGGYFSVFPLCIFLKI